MDVPLTPELENFVTEQVSSGLYHSTSEVIVAALRLLKQHDELKYTHSKIGEKLSTEQAASWQQSNQGVRLLGQDRGLFTVPEDFNAPLPDDLVAAFEQVSQ